MLEFLKFEIGGCMGGYTVVEANVKDEQVYYSVDNTPLGHVSVVQDDIPYVHSKEWLSRLEKLHINRWSSKYQPEDVFIMDGTQWSLEYKEAGKRCRHISGDNAYPSNWEEFMEFMDELAPEAVLIDPEQIEHIEFSYRHYMKIAPKHPFSDPPKPIIWDYSESLLIDRKSEKLVYTKNIGTGCVITHECYVQGGIEQLLEGCEDYFSDFDSEKIADGDKETPMMNIIIMRHSGEHNEYIRSYNRYGIPDDWYGFINKIRDFIALYGFFGNVFDADIFKHGVKTGEYIYCCVEFEGGSKSYYYRTEDNTLQVGNKVVVPVGSERHESIAIITDIEYFTEDTVPLPLDRTKTIIRKYEELDEYNKNSL